MRLKCLDESFDTGKDSPTQAIDCDVAKEAFDHVQPGGARQGGMGMEAGVAREPCLHLRMFVRQVVVADDVDLFVSGSVAPDQIEEAQPFPVLFHALYDDLAGGGVHRREWAGRAVALVVVGHRLVAAFPEREPRLSAVERLALTLFITQVDDGMPWLTKIDTDHVFEFFLEAFVVGELEAFDPARLESVNRPDSSHARWAHSSGRRH